MDRKNDETEERTSQVVQQLSDIFRRTRTDSFSVKNLRQRADTGASTAGAHGTEGVTKGAQESNDTKNATESIGQPASKSANEQLASKLDQTNSYQSNATVVDNGIASSVSHHNAQHKGADNLAFEPDTTTNDDVICRDSDAMQETQQSRELSTTALSNGFHTIAVYNDDLEENKPNAFDQFSVLLRFVRVQF